MLHALRCTLRAARCTLHVVGCAAGQGIPRQDGRVRLSEAHDRHRAPRSATTCNPPHPTDPCNRQHATGNMQHAHHAACNTLQQLQHARRWAPRVMPAAAGSPIHVPIRTPPPHGCFRSTHTLGRQRVRSLGLMARAAVACSSHGSRGISRSSRKASSRSISRRCRCAGLSCAQVDAPQLGRRERDMRNKAAAQTAKAQDQVRWDRVAAVRHVATCFAVRSGCGAAPSAPRHNA